MHTTIRTKSKNLACRIIENSSRAHPADAVLRVELKAERDLSPESYAEVSKAVFAYFRWMGWLNKSESVSTQVERALHLADEFAEKPDGFSDGTLTTRAVPHWLGGEMDVTAAWVRSLQEWPKLWLRAKRGSGSKLAAALGDCQTFGDGLLPDSLYYRGTQDLFRTPEFHAGKFEVQDISSQAVSLICDPQPGETWWDACAGEGGKTLHLSDLMANKGLIWASDRAEWRLQKLKRRAARAGVFNYRVATWRDESKLPTRTKFDGVLIDAPCSGIGTWQRNPHARWTTTVQDVRDLSDIQKRLLVQAASAVKPGGKLVYSVCTLTRSETVKVVEDWEPRFPEFERLPVRNPLEAKAQAAVALYIWPQASGGNGMFVAAWRRR